MINEDVVLMRKLIHHYTTIHKYYKRGYPAKLLIRNLSSDSSKNIVYSMYDDPSDMWMKVDDLKYVVKTLELMEE